MRVLAEGGGWQRVPAMLRAGARRAGGALWRQLLDERDRWMLWAPVLIGLGAAVYFLLPVEPSALLSGVLVAGAAIGLALAGRDRALARGLAMVALLVAVGFAAGQLRTALKDPRTLAQPLGPVEVTGRIAEVERFPNAVRVTLDAVFVAELPEAATPRRLRLRLRGEQPALAPGEVIAVRAMLSPPPGPSLPGAYDFQRHAFFNGLGAVGYSIGPAKRTADAAAEPTGLHAGAALWFASLRARVSARVHAALPEPQGSVTLALLTGETQGIPPAMMEAIRASGLAHLLSISGLHIGLVAGIVFVTTRSLLALIPWLALRFPVKKLAALLSVAAAAFYTLLAGAPVPAQRSFLMVAIVLLAVLVDRQGISMRLVAWAALAVLLTQPESLTGPSFQMSFAAVVALIAAYEVARERRQRQPAEQRTARRVLLYPAGIVLSTLVASLATTPFAAYHFDRFQLYGVVANLIAVPVTSFWIMPWAVPAMLLMPSGLEAPLLQAMGWGVSVVLWIARLVADWPGAVVLLPPMPPASLALITVGGLWLCLWRRRWRLGGLIGIAAGAGLMLLARSPDLLIDGGGRLVAVRAATGDLLFSGRTPRGVRERWLQRDAGTVVAGYFPLTGRSSDGSLRCDAQGCVFERNGQRVAIARTSDSLDDDCRLADLVVSLEPVSGDCLPAPWPPRRARASTAARPTVPDASAPAAPDTPEAMRSGTPAAADGPGPRAAPEGKARRDAFGPAATLISATALARDGTHAVWLEPHAIRIVSVAARRGDRPWTIASQSPPVDAATADAATVDAAPADAATVDAATVDAATADAATSEPAADWAAAAAPAGKPAGLLPKFKSTEPDSVAEPESAGAAPDGKAASTAAHGGGAGRGDDGPEEAGTGQ